MAIEGGQVASYFDAISESYDSRYSEQNPFHNYFFRQRLHAATEGLCFDGKSVLDIGAGTGALYDELIQRNRQIDYFACDVSSRMLEQSRIPKDRMFVGSPTVISFPRRQFDLIFSLGVTTYQTPEELAGNWNVISARLSPDGIAVISFTNRNSIDHAIREATKFAKPFGAKRIFGQSFPTFAYRAADIEVMAGRVGLHIARIKYLNQTFSPFNTLLPRPSVRLAKLIERAPDAMLPMLSSDFIVFVQGSQAR